MVIVNTLLACFVIQPRIVTENYVLSVLWYSLVLYLFVNTVTNASLVYFTDVSSLRLTDDREWRHQASERKTNCKRCVRPKPARCHHCIICDQCVLRRDHHCFFLCSCIGYHNQKYFVFFTFFMALAGLYAAAFTTYHICSEYGFCLNKMNLDFEDSNLHLVVFLVSVALGSLFGGIAACSFLFWQLKLICRGQTQLEYRRGITSYTKRDKLKHIEDIFGSSWMMFIIVPIYFNNK
ncbi:hypothetical protein CAPTEDRAFT_180952 [Capitella teleta]|uniref:Palmitoyltransferase n=1 Tax=Capitella teleta TaxID=283909 RepID=R7UNH8_CAPTE|nr:hypothetical protein CAPTEDRAFT_180952 [Capitella teleta]|eukprot:ELU07643.1 hypothetical protein CAPTEDRAFT_180952 [Capitella teleta]